MDGVTEEKIGKLWSAIENVKGDIKTIAKTVFGNGIEGHDSKIRKAEAAIIQLSSVPEVLKDHDSRLKEAEDKWLKRRETCPVLQESADKKTQRQIVIGLWINGAMMLCGFIALVLKG